MRLCSPIRGNLVGVTTSWRAEPESNRRVMGLQSIALPLGDPPEWQADSDSNRALGFWRPWVPPGPDLYETRLAQSRQSGPMMVRTRFMILVFVVEVTGIEPATLCLQGRRSPN